LFAAFPLGREFASTASVRLEKATFGPMLRAARERRGVTLEQIAAQTKLSVELWADLEENDFSRWPKQIYARSYIRDYAMRIGLGADEVVDEFCRLFPEWGDRRAEKGMRGHAAIVNHDLDWQDLPTKEQRRESARPARARSGFFGRNRTRVLAAALDLAATLILAVAGPLLRFGFWPSLAVAALSYNLAGTLLSSRGVGLIASEWLIRTISSMPAARRLISSRVEGA
jgi:transcriptional regulator with XRE-family HTH domain